MSKFIQQRYEEAILDLRSIPLDNYYVQWPSGTYHTRQRLNTKHHDILNSLYHFLSEWYIWDKDVFYEHMRHRAFEPSRWYHMRDFAHPERKNRWPKHTNYYRHKRSYQRRDTHLKKEPREPRWSDSKKSWRKERHRSGWKQHAKKTTTRYIRGEVKKCMFNEDYEKIPTDYKKYHWYDYY